MIFDTDRNTGLTHINHANLSVEASSLKLHSSAITGNATPMADPLSFLLFNKLKEKYTLIDTDKVIAGATMPKGDGLLAQAS